MPRMNGAELLAEVMKRHPSTVRLILSGYADKDLILKCVGSTHQYLAKPCDAESLKATVARASNLEGSLQNERLKTLVCQMNRLPSIPDPLHAGGRESQPGRLLGRRDRSCHWPGHWHDRPSPQTGQLRVSSACPGNCPARRRRSPILVWTRSSRWSCPFTHFPSMRKPRPARSRSSRCGTTACKSPAWPNASPNSKVRTTNAAEEAVHLRPAPRHWKTGPGGQFAQRVHGGDTPGPGPGWSFLRPNSRSSARITPMSAVI